MADRFSVLIEDNGERFSCDASQSLLRSMEVLGRRGIPVGCRGGGCGVCKVHVTGGAYHTRKMSRACLSEAEEASGVVLACKLFPDSDLSLQVVGRMSKALQLRRE
ncbi:MAG: 2Fe-2S iron-sulfur cluster-binding protein [Azoarcus sp.]|nr:2Fe-2S iron-sulfur cluster-binding protein [Azoarcus sp.]PKO51018.1 MAG: ferredoxin [Betaproteobacteria bacterium HGW-Betaproteobacteria-21]